VTIEVNGGVEVQWRVVNVLNVLVATVPSRVFGDESQMRREIFQVELANHPCSDGTVTEI
jgi:hypothetical protein